MQADFYPRSKTHQSDALLLFFHGWGGDSAMLSHLSPSQSHDVMVISDYRDMCLSAPTLSRIQSYNNVDMVAWSFGVWVAAATCLHYDISPQRGVAYNGTLFPIDDALGIPSAIAEATLTNLTPRTMDKFRRRMMGSQSDFEKLNNSADSRRSFEALHDELTQLYREFECPSHSGLQASDVAKATHLFHQVVIADKDFIIPSAAQRNAWQATDASISQRAAAHFCFYHYSTWDSLLNEN